MTNLAALQTLHGIQRRLLDVEQNLNLIQLSQETSMPVPQTVTDVIKAIDDATNKIAERIQKLIDGAAAGQLDAAAIVAALQPEVNKLTALGADGTPASVQPPAA